MNRKRNRWKPGKPILAGLVVLVAAACLFSQTKASGTALGQGKLQATLEYLNGSMLPEGETVGVIVQFEDDIQANADETIKAQKKQGRRLTISDAGGAPDQEYDNIPALSAHVSYQVLKKLEKDPRVKRISVDHPIQGSLYNTARAVGADQVWAGVNGMPGFNGTGVRIAVLDSGIDDGADVKPSVVTSTATAKSWGGWVPGLRWLKL